MNQRPASLICQPELKASSQALHLSFPFSCDICGLAKTTRTPHLKAHTLSIRSSQATKPRKKHPRGIIKHVAAGKKFANPLDSPGFLHKLDVNCILTFTLWNKLWISWFKTYLESNLICNNRVVHDYITSTFTAWSVHCISSKNYS